MAVFIITCDLRQLSRNYQPLYERLSAWRAIHILDHAWAINADTTVNALRDDLLTQMDADDRLIVAETDISAWSNLIDQTSLSLKRWM